MDPQMGRDAGQGGTLPDSVASAMTGVARPRGGAGPGRQPGNRRFLLPLAAAALVLAASSTDMLGAMGPAARALWEARWDRLGDPPAVDPALPVEAIKARILALLNDPATLAGVAGPGERAVHSFDGCVLVLSVRADPALCEGAGSKGRIADYERRIDLRHLMTHPAFVEERGAIVAAGGSGLLHEAVLWRWLPRVQRQVEEELHGYLLLDPANLTAADPDARFISAAQLAQAVEAGEIGPVVRNTHKTARYCTGERLTEPFGGRRVGVAVPPAQRPELVDLVHALGAGPCRGGGWLLDW